MPRGIGARFSKKDKLRFGIGDPAPKISKREPRRNARTAPRARRSISPSSGPGLASIPLYESPPPTRQPGHDFEAQTINIRTTQRPDDRESPSRIPDRLRPLVVSGNRISRADGRTADNRVNVQPLVSRSTMPKFYSYDIEPALLPLTELYPAINPEYFQEIYENRFKAEYLFKLSNSFAKSCLSTRRLRTVGGSTRVVNVETDVVAEDLESPSDFFKCLGIYCGILVDIISIAHPTNRSPLHRALANYIKNIGSFCSEGHSFESIRNYHFAFHKKRAILGIDDPAGWSNRDLELEQQFMHKNS